eukprot:scaffold142576_cov23-Tisochrysis_lutea.AAC.2
MKLVLDFPQGQPVNNIVITARECTRAIAEERLEHASATGVRRLITQALVAVEVMRVRALVCVCAVYDMLVMAGSVGLFFSHSSSQHVDSLV